MRSIHPMLRLTLLLAMMPGALAAPVFALAAPERTDRWPQFRGPEARGVSDASGLPDRWSTKENVAWSVSIPGRGWSSPIVWDGKVFVTSAINEGPDVEPKKGLYPGGEQREPVPAPVRFMLFCLDLESGKVLWEREAHQGRPPLPIHIKNSHASETPVTDGKRVFAYFGNIGLFAYDLDGNKLWERTLPPVKTRLNWGTAASPAVHADRIYLVNDNEESSYLLALDAGTGKEIFRVARDEKSNWSTPFVWTNERRTEIVTAGTNKVRSYSTDGELLWELGGGMSAITIATPYTGHGLLYVTSGFVMDRKKPIYAIQPGAQGDISLTDGRTSSEFVAWSQPTAAPYNPSTVVYGDHLYSLLDFGFLACYDARTGKEVYERQRLGTQVTFTASPWAYDGKIFCLNEDGETYVIKAGAKYELLHKNTLDEMCMASPALAGNCLLIRTLTRLYKIAETGSGR